MVRQKQIQQSRKASSFAETEIKPVVITNVKRTGLKLLSILFCLILLPQTTIVLAEVSASTGRTVLSIDETFVLEIKSENASGDPDLTVLEENFQIMGRSQSQNYSLINGRASQTHIWNITLLPKKTGELTIPAIKVGNDITRTIHLVIQKQSSTPGIDGKKVFLKINLDNSDDITSTLEDDSTSIAGKSYYVQQQIIITVRLFHRIRFSNATLSDLELTNTVVEKLGNDANYSKVVGKHRYNIIERRYALYPQQSGELTIPAMTFTGNAEISQNFSLFSRPGRQIISRTKPITLNILPIPENYTGKNWLPAENLQIESEIIEDPDSITSGEAITRNIIVRAKGLLGSQLPATSIASSNVIKTYPDKEKLSNQLIDGKVIGIRHDTVAIIPLKSGEFTLPEIKIDWWNTTTNQQETTRLAAQTFLAQASNEPEPAADQKRQLKTSSKVVAASDTPVQKESEQQITEISEEIIDKEVSITKNLWFWISIALFIIWSITLALFFVVSAKNKKLMNKTSKDIVNKNYHKEYLQAVYDACGDNNAGKANRALIQWAANYFKQPMLSGLSEVIQIIDDEQLRNAINDLESSQYSQDKHSWNGADLISALTHCINHNKLKEQNKRKKIQAFSSLNP